ncbi:Hypothetical Protein FCC1311_112442 [Hondaea fermentalgiana]|uniref:Uncharacterized protein n=1 Tax=Hondaea fermentalgiana TaxID=2315210 RepID=A0A2R5H2F7_9STRA|nr:Hypothetical Protein FCC1311_112442 [Hondaea fermentalgiana]|eukprot:GBG35021.1 Hypothetical Protein FCC1311_112442 [Hondaea fermentalgiana]
MTRATLILRSAKAQTSTCSTSANIVSWQDSAFPGCGLMAFDMGGCCGNVLSTSSDAVCSSTTFETAYCENTFIDGGCTDFTPNASDTLTSEINVTYAETGGTGWLHALPSSTIFVHRHGPYQDRIC